MTRLKSSLPAWLFTLAALISILFIPALPTYALDITSQRTERHILVPGTNAFFAPPPGLVLASEFSGFESKNRRIEVIVAFLDGPISGIEQGFTEASFMSLGMSLMAKGDFTIDSRRAVLYKVQHDDGNMKWGKWVMLAENGPGTLVANAVFVSGDTDAAVELEQMLKGVYMELVPTAEIPEETQQAEAQPEEANPDEPSVVRGDDDSYAVSPDITPPASDAVAELEQQATLEQQQTDDERDGFDRNEALSILAREEALSPEDVASHEEREQPVPEDKTESETGQAESGAEPEARGSARIITEDGVIHDGDSGGAAEDVTSTEE